MPQKNDGPSIVVNSPTGDKELDTLVKEIDELLQPFTHDLCIRTDKFSNGTSTIVIEATIKARSIR